MIDHTPGPWDWDNTPGSGCNLYGPKGVAVISHAAYEGMWFSADYGPTDVANALLIRAAPDMLEALNGVREFLREEVVGLPYDHPLAVQMAAVDAAIQRATQP